MPVCFPWLLRFPKVLWGTICVSRASTSSSGLTDEFFIPPDSPALFATLQHGRTVVNRSWRNEELLCHGYVDHLAKNAAEPPVVVRLCPGAWLGGGAMNNVVLLTGATAFSVRRIARQLIQLHGLHSCALQSAPANGTEATRRLSRAWWVRNGQRHWRKKVRGSLR